MRLEELLEKIGIAGEDARAVLTANRLYGEDIAPIAKAYMETDRASCAPQLAQIKALAEEKGASLYMLYLLFWLASMPTLYREYKEEGIDEEIFYASMADVGYKVKECKEVKGEVGVFVDWFTAFFEKRLFALGRLQYHHHPFCIDEYTVGDFTVKRDEPVYQCHIPSSGRLLPEDVLDSFARAYDFYKHELSGSVMPICCASWLLFPAYQGTVFPEGSNTARFAALFDIIDVYHTEEFVDFWRVFGIEYEKRDKGIPTDTGLRRRMLAYMEKGGGYGAGYGIILYDGEKKEIINRK